MMPDPSEFTYNAETDTYEDDDAQIINLVASVLTLKYGDELKREVKLLERAASKMNERGFLLASSNELIKKLKNIDYGIR